MEVFVRSALLVPFVLVSACSQPSSSNGEPSPAANAGTSASTNASPVDTATPAASKSETLDGRVKAWVKAAYAGTDMVMAKWGGTDLDGDGKDEVLAYVGGPTLCGTGGCDLIVLKDNGAALTKITGISVAQMPVGVLETSTKGWRDLAVTTFGGGAPRRIMKVPFDGKSYAENPTVAPASEVATIGTEVIADGELEKLN